MNIEEKLKKQQAWRRKYGISDEGMSYVYFCGDAYDIRDELKANGFRYNDILKWHSSIIPVGYEDKVIEIHDSIIIEYMAWGEGVFYPWAKKTIADKIAEKQPRSTSIWIGEEGKRIYNLPVTFLAAHNFEGFYGSNYVYRFEDDNGNKLTWFSSTVPAIEKGKKYNLTATVKKHDIYREEQVTIITRAKLEEIL